MQGRRQILAQQRANHLRLPLRHDINRGIIDQPAPGIPERIVSIDTKMPVMPLRLRVVSAMVLIALDATAQTGTPEPIGLLLAQVERAVLTGDRTGFLTLTASERTAGPDDFWRQMSPTPTQIVIKERDRSLLADGAQRLVLDILTVRSDSGSVSSWHALVRPAASGAKQAVWQIADLVERSTIAGLYRLSLDTTREFAVSQLRLTAPDLELAMRAGKAFIATVPDGATALVLVGRGTMSFSPADDAERTQLRLFSGNPSLQEEFDTALLRMHPAQVAPLLGSGTLVPMTVSPADARRAQAYFENTIGQTLTLELNDLSRDRWSLIPPLDDLVAEVRTRRLGTLTYGRVQNQLEDVTLFDRRARKTISAYASPQKLASRGRFYSEDEASDYDVESIDLDADIDPVRPWIDGRATLTLVTRTSIVSLPLKLAEPLAVRSVESEELGRLTVLRVAGQDSVIVKLPSTIPANRRFTLRLTYGGRLPPQPLDPELLPDSPPPSVQNGFDFAPEPRYIYSTRSYWYPQAPMIDQATARLRVSVSPEYRVVASGRAVRSLESAVTPANAGQRPRTSYVFEADRPVPYLACVISRFDSVLDTTVDLGAAGTLALTVQANSRQRSRARDIALQATSMLQFYASLLGDVPYPALTLAVSESETPGGHGPAYVALLDQTLMTSRLAWDNDPVNFRDYPPFVLAHELAHQWWGQAVSVKNYHERWISEGVAQYFAALYAERDRGPDAFSSILRQMQRSAIEASAQGPIALGSRLGHVRGESRVLRAVLYNKSAMVLHMLRRLIGDEAFFDGLRRFYGEFRFKKAGTADFRMAMERASDRSLEAFVDGWILGSGVPRVKVTPTRSPTELQLTFEQSGPVLPVPVTVTLVYTDGSSDDISVPVTEASVSRTLPLRGPLRDVRIDEDHGALATFQR